MVNQTKSAALREHLLTMIDEDLRPHDRLPTERDLAEGFTLSRLTVRRVLERLHAEGRVYRIQGAGTFVSEPRIAKSFELTSFSEDMRQRGLKAGSALLAAEEVPAGAKVGYLLGMSPGEPVYRIKRIRSADGQPICLETSYLPSALFPGLLDMALDGSLYELMSTAFRIELERADQEIRCTVLEPEAAALLEVPSFSPAFSVERTGYDERGRRVESAESVYRGDRYSYRMVLHRTSRGPVS
jgi:GntR family transcriptional regulator, N-acetylglucosamine utilization regulator